MVTTDQFSVRVTKITLRIELRANLSNFFLSSLLTQWNGHIVKVDKLDNFELHSSPKLIFTSIQGLPSKFVLCESFLESNSPDSLALCETNVEDSIDSSNFPVRGCLPIIWKDYVIYTLFLIRTSKSGP